MRSEPATAPLPPLWAALLPTAALVGLLFYSIAILEGSGHIPLIAATAVAALTAVWVLKQPWKAVEQGMLASITHALPAVLILMAVGLLIGVWIAAGVVPLLIYYGLQILAPSYFLAAACAACGLISLAVGSSWSTAATAGLAPVGVGQAMGIPAAMTAGAVVSGAYFGDKMSPLSDTTNLASATAGSELFEHIRHMMFTTIPALAISLAVYLYLGMGFAGAGDAAARAYLEMPAYVEMTEALRTGFNLTPWLLLAPLVTLLLIARRTPPLPALLAGVLAGSILLLVFQPGNAPQGIGSVVSILYGGFVSETGKPAVDELLSSGGLKSMLDTIALIVCAFAFGGVMEASGMLARLTRAILSGARSAGSLIVATVATGVGLNILTADQYLAVVLSGRMYRAEYQSLGLHPKNLSRAVEDSATLTSALVPWNTCGAYMASVLGVATLSYAPYALLNWLGPLISIACGLTGITLANAVPAERPGSAGAATPAD